MRLKHIADIRLPVADNGPSQQHAAGLSADHPGTDHMIPDSKIVFRGKVFPDHFPHFFIPGHHDVAHSAAVFRDIRAAFMKQFGPVKKTIPGVGVLFFRRTLCLGQRLVKAAGLHAIQDRTEMPGIRLKGMRKKHRIGITIPDFFRPNIDVPAVRVNIDEQLSCIQDFIDSLYGMLSPDDRKEGNCVQNEKERAGDPEKVAHHQICCPGSLQIGKTVENVKGIFSFLFDDIMNVYGKGFEPVRQGQLNCFDLRMPCDQRLMPRKAEINDITLVTDCLLHIGFHKQPELGQI